MTFGSAMSASMIVMALGMLLKGGVEIFLGQMNLGKQEEHTHQGKGSSHCSVDVAADEYTT